MQAKLFLFAAKKNEENATFSHLTLGSSVSQVFEKINSDLYYLINGLGDNPSTKDKEELSKVLDYFKSCSLWCLGSIDFVSGMLESHLEEHDKFIDILEVLKDVK